MKWFRHDSNAHADAKLEKILIRYGAEGYALYWYCLELIAGKVDADHVTFELEHDAELLGHRLKIDTLRVERIMRDMVELGLFEESSGRVSCLKLAQRLDERWTRNADLKGVIKATRAPDLSADRLQTVLAPLPLEEKKREEKRTEEILVEPNGSTCDLRKRSPPVPVAEIVELYHQMLCPPLPRVEKLTDTRRGYIQQRWRQDLTDLEHWRNFFEHVRGSDFLMGRAKARDGRPPFRADLEWLCRPANYTKIAEDKYHVAVR